MRPALNLSLAALALGACAQVVGADFDDYTLGNEAAVTSSSSSSSGSGGMGGTTTSTSSSSSAGGMGGTDLCGNGTLDGGETCDGDCPTDCVDGDKCTADQFTGTPETCDVECNFAPAPCGVNDGCCPANCLDFQDPDCPTPALDDVLVVGNNTQSIINGVRDQLIATGRFNSVTGMDVTSTVLNTGMLAPYDAVLVYSNANLWADAVAAGNAFADYYDGGGRVVLALGIGCGDFSFAGRFFADGYPALDGIGILNEMPAVGLTNIVEPGNFLFDGVPTANVSTDLLCNSNPTTGAVPIADWNASNGAVVAMARKQIGGRWRVDMNFFPDPGNPELIQILANALYFE